MHMSIAFRSAALSATAGKDRGFRALPVAPAAYDVLHVRNELPLRRTRAPALALAALLTGCGATDHAAEPSREDPEASTAMEPESSGPAAAKDATAQAHVTVLSDAQTPVDAAQIDSSAAPRTDRDAQVHDSSVASSLSGDASTSADLACASEYTLCATTDSLHWIDCVRAAEACGLFAPGATGCANTFLDCLSDDLIEVIAVCVPPVLACGVGIPSGLLP